MLATFDRYTWYIEPSDRSRGHQSFRCTNTLLNSRVLSVASISHIHIAPKTSYFRSATAADDSRDWYAEVNC